MGTRITQKGTSFKGATKLYFLHYSHVMRVPKRPFVFLQQNTKFYSCLQTAICCYTAKYETLQLHSSRHLFFYSQIQNFTVVPEQPLVIIQPNMKLYNCTQKVICFV